MNKDITEEYVATLEEQIADIHADLALLVEDIRDSEIAPAEAAETLAEIVSTIARIGELYATPTPTKQ